MREPLLYQPIDPTPPQTRCSVLKHCNEPADSGGAAIKICTGTSERKRTSSGKRQRKFEDRACSHWVMAACCSLQQAHGLGFQCGISLSSAATSTSASAAAATRKNLLVVCRRRDRGDKEFLPYHVTVVTPPPRHLGVHSLPPNTQCGETVTVKGEPYIVSGVTYQYRLRRGKYEARQKRLDVQSTGRYLLNLYLDNLLESS